MRLRSTLAALAPLALAASASPLTNPDSPNFCRVVTLALSQYHEQTAATSFCSSFLSIHTETSTIRATTRTTVSAPKVCTVTTTITPSTTVTATSKTTVTPLPPNPTITTVPTTTTVVGSTVVTTVSTTTTVRTTTTTATSVSTSTSTSTTTSTVTSFTVTTTTKLDTNFQCFTTGNPSKRRKRELEERAAASPRCWSGLPRQVLTTACDCLSLTTPTKRVTSLTTVTRTSSYASTTTSTVTGSPTTITVTVVRTKTVAQRPKTSTTFSVSTVSSTLTSIVSSTSTSTSVTTLTVTTPSTTTVTTTSSSVTTTTSTSTATTSIGTDLIFRIHADHAGNDYVAAGAVSGPPYNFFYFRPQLSGATTFKLDDNCQLFETFAGVYAQQKPSDPNPGIVFSGSGVPVTCEVDIDTNDIACSNPGGGDTAFLCDTSFGANTYPLWWLGQDNSPGSRCQAEPLTIAYTF